MRCRMIVGMIVKEMENIYIYIKRMNAIRTEDKVNRLYNVYRRRKKM